MGLRKQGLAPGGLGFTKAAAQGQAKALGLLGLGLSLALAACGTKGPVPSGLAQRRAVEQVRVRLVGEIPPPEAGQAALRPLLLVHGHQGSSANWVALIPYLKQHGFAPIAVDFETNAWSDWTFQLLAEQLAVHHKALVKQSGLSHVDILAHSLGGLISRQYIKFLGGEASVNRLVCLGSPHHGVGYASFGPWLVVAQAFRPHSPQLNALNRPDETHGSVQYTNLWSTGDQMEWLPYASGRQVGAFNHKTHGTSHGDMTTDPKLFPHVVRFLQRPLDEVPGAEVTIP